MDWRHTNSGPSPQFTRPTTDNSLMASCITPEAKIQVS
jgi:hypothetical protein